MLTCWVKALEYLAIHGTPDGADIDAPAPVDKVSILSHRLEVPAGCRVVTASEVGGRIQCESSMLTWNTIEKRLVPSTKRWLQESIPTIKSMLGGGFSEEEVSCRVEGVLATCVRLTKQVPSKGVLNLYVGAASVEDYALMISCAFSDKGVAFPSVCNNTLSMQ